MSKLSKQSRAGVPPAPMMSQQALKKLRRRVRSRSNDYGIPKCARYLIYTSVADVKSALPHRRRTDWAELRKALEICLYQGQKTKAVLIARRIKQLGLVAQLTGPQLQKGVR